MLDITTVRSTKSEVEEFKESTIWLDICDELNDLSKRSAVEYDLVGEPHINDSGQLIVPNSSETLIHLGDIKGRRKATDYFLNLPDIILQILEEKKDDTKYEPTD